MLFVRHYPALRWSVVSRLSTENTGILSIYDHTEGTFVFMIPLPEYCGPSVALAVVQVEQRVD